MRRAISLSVFAVFVLAAAAFALQQTYPNLPDVPVVFENDQVIVQRIEFPTGSWQGEHSHAGNQLAVAITEVEQIVKEGGKESTRTLKPGEVLWVEKGTHDHKNVKAGMAVLITLK